MKNLTGYVERAYKKNPDKVVLRYEDSFETYKSLREKARKIATALIKLNNENVIRPVVVMLPRSCEPIVCYMGALYSANPYVPVNYALPDNRLKVTIETLNPLCCITDDEGKARMSALCDVPIFTPDELLQTQEDESLINTALHNACDCDPAYIMFTSGSTGTPKGVTISHRGVVDYVDSMLCEFDIDQNTVIGMQSPLYFDISVFDMYVTFACGCELVIIPDKIFMFPSMITDYVNEKNINLIYWVPTTFSTMVNADVFSEKKFEYVKQIIFAGETMQNSVLNVMRKAMPDCTYANLYGPTETSVISTIYKVDREFADDEPLPVGVPCKNSRVFLLDEKNELVTEENQRGEICISGIGVGLGYWNNKEVSDKAFCQNPLNDKFFDRMYRTGDIGYFKDGLLMFAGRADSQIKHRGNRIELGDIETACTVVENVKNACAVYDYEKSEIVVFIESGFEWNLRKFNLELKKHIPSYMLPSRLVILDKMPLTPNGKRDRVSLKNMLK